MSADTGGAAFPVDGHHTMDGTFYPKGSPGMTLLDYFAGQALAGMCVDDGEADFEKWDAGHLAENAYRFASAMLTERARRMEEKP